jgi:hypothetical protein
MLFQHTVGIIMGINSVRDRLCTGASAEKKIIHWCLTPTVVVFQLYRGISTESPQKPIPVL